jgi:oligopeptide transport system substrate-binding protein
VVEQRRRPVPEYSFRHGLVQEVAYASLLEARRLELHRNVGEALEEIHREAPEQVFGLLGRHFAEAGERERAVRYLLNAGDAARRLYADEEALEHYRRALDLLDPTHPRVRQTYFKIALTHHLAFDFERADEAWALAAAAHEGVRVVDRGSVEQLRTAIGRPPGILPGFGASPIGWWLCEQLFRGLLRIDHELNVVLEVARECRVSSDGCVYRFLIGADECWSDGVPVSAEDFVFAWEQGGDQSLPDAHVLQDVEEMRALEDGALEIRLVGPRSYFPYVLASPPAFPWPRHLCQELGDDWMRPEHLVSNGPFQLSALEDEHMALRPNRAWPRPRGNVGDVDIEFGEWWVGQEAWDTDRYDFVISGPHIEGGPETLVDSVPMLSSYYVGFRGTGPPFDDERVRKAFAHGCDRERLTRVATAPIDSAGRGGVIPPAMPGHSHRVALEHDEGLARRLLAEAGHPGARGLPNLTIFSGAETPAGAQELARQWSELGARVEVRTLSFDEVWAAIEDGTADAWLWGWMADLPDPYGMLDGLLQTKTLYRDAEIMELLDRARSALDQGVRMRLYREVERLWIAERAAVIPVAYLRDAVVRRPWVEGLWATPLSKGPLDEVVVRRGVTSE